MVHPKQTRNPSDQQSIQPKIHPTDNPSSPTETQNEYCFDCYEIYSIHSHYKVNQRGGAADLWWRPQAATFVVALNIVGFVAVNTIFVLRFSKTGRSVGMRDSRLDGWSVGRTKARSCITGTICSTEKCCTFFCYF